MSLEQLTMHDITLFIVKDGCSQCFWKYNTYSVKVIYIKRWGQNSEIKKKRTLKVVRPWPPRTHSLLRICTWCLCIFSIVKEWSFFVHMSHECVTIPNFVTFCLGCDPVVLFEDALLSGFIPLLAAPTDPMFVHSTSHGYRRERT